MKRIVVAVPLVVFFLASLAVAQSKEKVIFSFDLTDGNLPNAGLVADKQGNLYGTTSYNGGTFGFGNVYELTQVNGTWQETVLYNFTGGADGAWPLDTLIFDDKGNLYGTAESGGQGQCVQSLQSPIQYYGCGVAFELSPSQNGWTETVLYSFLPGQNKGVIPVGGLVFDKAGNLYGTTWAPGVSGGPLKVVERENKVINSYWGCSEPGCGGTVFELSPSNSGWTENDIYAFTGLSDGSVSMASLAIDGAGRLYGTTSYGGNAGCIDNYGCGVVFRMAHGSSGWKESVLYAFSGTDGGNPTGGLIGNSAGHIFSTTFAGGTSNFGTVFELTFSANKWNEKVLYNFTNGDDGGSPEAGLAADAKGNLYGTATTGGNGGATASGVVFKLAESNGVWAETVLHNFFYGSGDGQSPYAPLIFGPGGGLYGTTQAGGADNHGAVYEVAP